MKYRISPANIAELKLNEIFVFGSNESGIHGAGAARFAMAKFGAVYGVGFGIQGQSLAIPTKDWSIGDLLIDTIGFYVERSIKLMKINHKLDFLVTEIGCGLAGKTPEQIAPLFKNAFGLKNVYLPQSFVNILTK